MAEARETMAVETFAVAFSHLSFSYAQQSRMALQDLSLSFPKGQRIALLGPNGSGKSTLLKIIAGLLIPTSGRLYIDDTLVTDDNVDKLINHRIGLVFQNPDSQFVGTTVRDDIAFGLENDRVAPSQMDGIIKDVISAVGLADRIDDEPSRLSGGQKQRVALAGVLARKPAILLLDEATSMLDPVSRKDIEGLVRKVKNANPSLTIIAVTHDIEEIKDFDEAMVLEDGRLAYQGEVKRLLETKALAQSLGVQPSLQAQIRESLKETGIETNPFDDPEGLWRQLCQSK